MKLFTLGVNHETAPVDIRETVSFSPDLAKQAFQELKEHQLLSECIILSTCNRTEIYGICSAENQADQVQNWLHDFFKLNEDSLSPYLYRHDNIEAVKHIMRVASGLNSLVLGEPQIFGQMKDAYNLAQQNKSVRQTMDSLFQHIFKTVKQVRTDTAIGNSPVSVAFSAVALSKQFFGDLSSQTAMLLGAGETVELVARHLKESNIGNLIIANRTFERAHQLAENVTGYAIRLDEIDNHLHEADIVIGSTGSPNAILSASQVAQALKQRKNSPMLMVDIAVPRDIEAQVGQLENVYLYTVDDLQEIIETNKQSRQTAALEAEEIIDLQADNFIAQQNALTQVKPLIQTYRQQANEIKEEALAQALNHLEQGQDPQQIITRLANQLTNKLLHTPSAQLHKAGIEGNSSLIDAAETLLIHQAPSDK
ncbi:glutamyl-tRNA reductase [Thiomicrorhabdus heinhorstiae]|uniref:Glutamyl-tRNA reductase n=1 Tax=Thiomicrorhabdus heinhorstiae TaxID=2748010 RepID=A0ABS0BWX1_9GAMM|nr:glutamyl-tRNA reductase [Thiomicrorhabdus heinhorstiae]MBF6058303.1 glutamyl-tRNA reductase [Thiomicrorhabdus heinhorstiae]